MAIDDDWRLTWEEDWMYGAQLERRSFSVPTPDWDHEHCVLCQTKFMEEPDDEAIVNGYVYGYDRAKPMRTLAERARAAPPEAPPGFETSVRAPTIEQWICPTCFEDFESRFQWTTVEPKD
jgi:hypothetical protein